ncbi:hypothetical protein OG906_43465 (plasmid) [Streptomyces sp. NBC_01426]|uniref:hypothetical protein n=1 Tax=Streptomyces sp. NBC_01426 TaxID=2975866 RepID=UPI002E37235A|nr:hypothetical protein [Streptomyces sp. NBC_01426]
MDPISYATGTDARMGGLDITISLTPTQAKALDSDAGQLADWLHTGLWALAVLRTGLNGAGEPYSAGPDDWHTAINDLDRRLIPRLEGIRDSVIRAHTQSGGSVADLALAMDVSRSTAQYRRESVLNGKDRPTTWENWALDGGPQNREHCNACGEQASALDPIVTTDDNDHYRIHRSHTLDPKDGFYGTSIISD